MGKLYLIGLREPLHKPVLARQWQRSVSSPQEQEAHEMYLHLLEGKFAFRSRPVSFLLI